MRELELYFDMDCTVYDLNGYITNIYSKEFNDNKVNNNYWFKDLDKANREYFERLLYTKGTFLYGDEVPNMVYVINRLKEKGFKIHFVTCPQFTGDCFVEKCEWLLNNFPWIELSTQLICTGNKGLLAKPNRILIDDDIKYLRQWENEDGISICFTQGWNKDWQGLRVNEAFELYDLILLMEGMI